MDTRLHHKRDESVSSQDTHETSARNVLCSRLGYCHDTWPWRQSSWSWPLNMTRHKRSDLPSRRYTQFAGTFVIRAFHQFVEWTKRHYWRDFRTLEKLWPINTLRPRQNGRHFPDDISKCIFLNETVWISIEISRKFLSKVPINGIPTLVQIMAWRRPGDKPLSEPMLVNLLTHICVTRPQWVNRNL